MGLKFIDEVCKKEGLRYFLCGGTLLGAVRHQGFIPWDDDIDIFMPRPDYERMIELTKDSEMYRLLSDADGGYYKHMKQEFLTHSVIHADETVVQVLKEDGKRQSERC